VAGFGWAGGLIEVRGIEGAHGTCCIASARHADPSNSAAPSASPEPTAWPPACPPARLSSCLPRRSPTRLWLPSGCERW
jgi:hypothetical protein